MGKWEETFFSNFCKYAKYALNFKYQTGSFLMYALKKKFTLVFRKTIDSGRLIDRIATNLPNFISNRIDREVHLETEHLYSELGKLQQLVRKTGKC